MERYKWVLVICLPLNINEAENLSCALNSELLECSDFCAKSKGCCKGWLLAYFNFFFIMWILVNTGWFNIIQLQ